MSNEITALDGATVHSLSTNQVVVSLQVAVKELVENALDAGASKITIRIVENGTELIEVKDSVVNSAPGRLTSLRRELANLPVEPLFLIFRRFLKIKEKNEDSLNS